MLHTQYKCTKMGNHCRPSPFELCYYDEYKLDSGSSVVLTTVVSVVMFIVGVVVGFAAGAIVVYCCAHHRKPPPPPAALYEEVVLPTTQRTQVQGELKLNDNVAYGQVSL